MTLIQPTAENPLEVIIDRKRWYRGKGGKASSLLRYDDRKMCCLGFDAIACGAKPSDIEYISDPEGSCLPLPGIVENGKNTEVCNKMIKINDNMDIEDVEREHLLTQYAKDIHRKFVFIN